MSDDRNGHATKREEPAEYPKKIMARQQSRPLPLATRRRIARRSGGSLVGEDPAPGFQLVRCETGTLSVEVSSEWKADPEKYADFEDRDVN